MIVPTKRPYRLSQGFGLNPKMYAPFGLKGHNGLDYATPVGTEIIAPEDGLVESGNDGVKSGYGLYVRLFNSKGEHVLAHLSKVIKTGNVKQGEVIGLSGNTGFSTGPHLHWGYRERNGVKGTVKNYSNGFLGYIDQAKLTSKKNNMKVVQVYRHSNDATVRGIVEYENMEEVHATGQDIVLYGPATLVRDSDNPEVSVKYGIPTFDSVKYLGLTPEKNLNVDSSKEKIKKLESENEKLKKKAQDQSLEIDDLEKDLEDVSTQLIEAREAISQSDQKLATITKQMQTCDIALQEALNAQKEPVTMQTVLRDLMSLFGPKNGK